MSKDIQRLDCGWWVPNGVYGGRYFDTLDVRGIPGCDLHTYQTALSHCSERRLALDGGAYIGMWSAYMAHDFDRVIAFEPDPTNVECFKRNIGLYPTVARNVACVSAALVQMEGSYAFVPGKAKAFGRHVKPAEATDVVQFPGVNIDGLALDALSLLKLDLEGFEYQALLGAAETIKRCRPVVVIEEKFDEVCKASNLLREWGMCDVMVDKVDHVFVWSQR